MPKFVCDYSAVSQIAKSLKEEAENITSQTSSYESAIASNLSSWEGKANSEFKPKSESEIAATKKSVEALNVLSQFLDDCVKSIHDTDNKLASKKI